MSCGRHELVRQRDTKLSPKSSRDLSFTAPSTSSPMALWSLQAPPVRWPTQPDESFRSSSNDDSALLSPQSLWPRDPHERGAAVTRNDEPPRTFNPLRSAHVRQAEKAEARRKQRVYMQAQAAAAQSNHAAAAPALALFRLPTPAAATATLAHWERRHVPQPNVFAQMLSPSAAAASPPSEHSSPWNSSSDAVSPAPRTHSDAERSISPGAVAPAASSTAAPGLQPGDWTPAPAQPRADSESSFNRTDSSRPPPTQQEVDEIARQIEYIDRQLRGELPLDSPRKSSAEESNAEMPSSPVAAAEPLQLQTRPPRTQRDYLTTAERRVIEQYKREQAWLEANPDASADPLSLFDAAAASPSVVAASPGFEASRLDDSLPSTIAEESPNNRSLAEARASETEEDYPHIQQPKEEPQVATAELAVAPSTAPVAPAADSAAAASSSTLALPPVPPVTHTASLSSLMRMSDLAYPELLTGYSSSRSLVKHVANPLAQLPHTLAASSPARPWQERSVASSSPPTQSMRERVRDGLTRMLDDAAPTPAAAAPAATLRSDPNASLLESLWAAEEDFERMMAEDLPEPHVARTARPHRPSSPPSREQRDKHERHPEMKGNAGADSLSAAAFNPRSPLRRSAQQRPSSASPPPARAASPPHFGPGALLHPRDEVNALVLDVPREAASSFAPRHHHQQQQQQQHRPDVMSLDMQRALAQSQRDSARQFLHVASLDVVLAQQATSTDRILPSNTAPAGDVLLAVQDFSLSPDVAELLDLDVDRRTGHLTHFQPARDAEDFGRLVPLRSMHILHSIGKRADLDPGSPSNHGSDRSHPGAEKPKQHADLPSPRSYKLLSPRSRAAAQSRAASSSSLSPRRGRRPHSAASCAVPERDSSPKLVRSHLHAAPDPVALHRHIAVRRARESIKEMDDDLEALSQRAAALSAEYQSDARALAAYEQRMAQRKEAMFASQLTRAQQHLLIHERNAQQARSTLQQIDDIMAEKQLLSHRGTRGSAQQQPHENTRPPRIDLHELQSPRSHREPRSTLVSPRSSRQPASPTRRKHVNVQHSPVGAAAAARASEASHNGTSTAASTKPTTAAGTRAGAAASHKAPVRRVPKSRKPMAKLESELDSALGQAQSLMADFMAKIL